MILNKRVRAYIYRRDQYDRVVAKVFVRTGLWRRRRDVGYEMLKRGLATLYEAKNEQYSEFGNSKDEYEKAQQRAKERKAGIWGGKEHKGAWEQVATFVGFAGKQVELETPREYKRRMAKEETEGKARQ